MKRVLITAGVVFATWIAASIIMGVIFAVTAILDTDNVNLIAGLLMAIILISVGVYTWKHYPPSS